MSDEANPVPQQRRKRRVNKSALIRKYLVEHPEMGPSEVAQQLAERKIKVTAAYVSDIKAKMKSGDAPAKPGRKPKSDTSPQEDMANAGQLMMSAIDLVMKAGYKEARAMLEMANKLVDRVREGQK